MHRAVPADQLDAEVARVVHEPCTAGPPALGSAKKLIQAVDGLSLEEAIPVTPRWIAKLRATPEAREGMTAFLEKRRPDFTGD